MLLLRALDGLSLRQAVLVGWLGGVAANVLLFTWLVTAVERLGDLPSALAWLAFAVFVAWSAGSWALLGALDARLRAAWPARRALLFPLAFVTAEHLWPQLFHWTSGVPQVASPLVSQAADLGGSLLLAWVLLAANAGLDAALGWALARRRGDARPFPVDAVVVAACAVLGTLGYGAWRRAQVAADAGPALRVALVQQVVADNRLTPRRPLDVQLVLEDLARQAGEGPPVDLVVFPEAALPRPLVEVEPAEEAPLAVRQQVEQARRSALTDVARIGARCRQRTLIGAGWWRARPGPTLEGTPILERRNSLAFVDGAGELRARYDKRVLLMFGEYLPGEGVAPWLRGLLPFAGELSPGPASSPLDLGPDLHVAPLICYEGVPPGLAAAAVVDPVGVDLLVAVTNDVWFDGTHGPDLHAMIERLRAIETRRALVRSATTGLTIAVAPDGSIVGRLPLGAPGVLRVEVPRPRDRRATTLYARLGDAFAWAATAAVALAIALGALGALAGRARPAGA